MLTFILQFLFFPHKKIWGYRQSTGQCKNLPQQIKADLRITHPPPPLQKKKYPTKFQCTPKYRARI